MKASVCCLLDKKNKGKIPLHLLLSARKLIPSVCTAVHFSSHFLFELKGIFFFLSVKKLRDLTYKASILQSWSHKIKQ